jgi:MarR family transcriptional regulator, organic hydroperoxide resistance regulator
MSDGNGPNHTLRELPCYLLYLGWRRAQSFYSQAFEPGMNPQRMYVLERLTDHNAATVTQLGALLGVDPGTISGLLSRMQRDGLLTRTRNPNNRLEVIVRLTVRGRAVHKKASRSLQALDAELMQHISPRDLVGLQQVVAAFAGDQP